MLLRHKRLDGRLSALAADTPRLEALHRHGHVTGANEALLNRKINKSPTTIDEPSVLKVHLTKPPVKRIDLQFPLGMEVTARSLKGVTIKDAMDAIHKAFKKRVSSGALSRPLRHC